MFRPGDRDIFMWDRPVLASLKTQSLFIAADRRLVTIGHEKRVLPAQPIDN